MNDRIQRQELPRDIQIEQGVDLLIQEGVRLPRWGWKKLGPYNGATGAERITGWQKLQLACQRGWLLWPKECSICAKTGSMQHHTENYFRPLAAQPVCRSCHYRIHRRFDDPTSWTMFVAEHSQAEWISRIAKRELDRTQSLELAAMPDPADATPLRL